MKALFCYDGPFYKDEYGNYFDSILNDQMFQRYLRVADALNVAIRTRPTSYTEASARMSMLTDKRISVTECPNLSSIQGLISNSGKCKTILKKCIAEADIVFIRLPSVIGNYSVDICRRLNKKYLIEVVGCPWDSYWNYSLKGKVLAPAAMISMKRRIAAAPYVLYVTNEFLQKRYPTHGKQVNCSNVELAPMDDEILNNRLIHIDQRNVKDIFVIGTAAGLDVLYKGQQYVIKAMGELKKQGITNIEYQLIGSGTGAYLREIAKECDVEDQVKIVGQIPHDKVFQWLDNLDAYIQPSRQEGLPRSMIEAMSRGVPCLGAKTAGIPELIDQKFVFTNSKTEIAEISTIITNLMRNDGLQKKQAKRNFKEALKYQRETLVERRTRFFESCIKGE